MRKALFIYVLAWQCLLFPVIRQLRKSDVDGISKTPSQVHQLIHKPAVGVNSSNQYSPFIQFIK